nr:hypothetical protein [Tanacetum cinerariifolium]
PPKPDLVFHTPPSDENEHLAFNVQLNLTKSAQDLPSTSSAPIIKDWVSDSEEEDIPKVPKDVPSLAQSLELVKTPRHSGLISPPPMSVAPHVSAATPSKSKPVLSAAARTIGAARPTVSKTLSAARVKAAKPSAVSAARINAVKPSAVTAVQHIHTKKVWRPKTLVLDHVFRTTCASMTLKWFNYNDALGRS